MAVDDISRKFDDAMALRDAGRLDEAADALRNLYDSLPEDSHLVSAVSGMLGGLYYMSGDYVTARDWFKKTTERSSTSELASVGLFHSCWDLNDFAGAIEEARRFLNLVPASNYNGLKEMLVREGLL